MSDLSGDPFARPSPSVAGEEKTAGEQEPAVGAPVKERRPGRAANPARRLHNSQQTLRWSLIVTAALILAYWFTQWPLPRLLSAHPDYNYYVIQPVIWLVIAGLAFYGWLRLEDRPPVSRLLIGIAVLVGIFHVAVLVIAGVIWDFGDSPLSGKLINYPKNLWFFTTLLAGAEFARTYLYHVWRRWNERLAFAGATVLLFAVGMAAAQWNPFDTLDHSMRIVGGRWLPALALSALCTWLASYGGLGPSFVYRWALVAFEWFSPILPNLDWPVLLTVGVGVPLLAVWLVRSIYEETVEGAARHPRAAEEEKVEEAPRSKWARWVGWGITALIVLLAVLFVVGVFGFHLSVVDGTSMEPSFGRGDVLIVKDGVDPASLKVQDVIQYHQGNLPIVHRIVVIEQGDAGLLFTTQGDNMDTADPPITADQIDGKVVFSLPGVGYLNLWIRGR